jgi:hypothetical protein
VDQVPGTENVPLNPELTAQRFCSSLRLDLAFKELNVHFDILLPFVRNS